MSKIIFCDNCVTRIEGELTTALDKVYHPRCFVCHSCKKPFNNGRFVPFRNNPYCHSCIDYKCGYCDKIISNESFVTLGGVKYHQKGCVKCKLCMISLDKNNLILIGETPYCSSCHKDAIRAPEVCPQCKRPIRDEWTSALNQKWHKECFTCSSCRSPFSVEFVVKNGKPYCQKCANHTCRFCNQVITSGQFITHNGKRIHSACFQCCRCYSPLNPNGFFEIGGKLYCEQHAPH